MKVMGVLDSVMDTQVVSDSFKKREFVMVIADNPNYPQFIKFEFIQDKCGFIDAFPVGTTIEIEFNLNGRKWSGDDGVEKVFNTLQAWKIRGIQPAQEPIKSDFIEEDLPF